MILEVILFEWLICRLEIVNNRLRKYVTCAFLIITQLVEIAEIIINPEQSISFSLVVLPISMASTLILFRERIAYKLTIFLFTYGYVDVIEYPVKILIGKNNTLMVYVVTIIVICMMGKIISRSEKVSSMIPRIEPIYFIIAAVIEIINMGIIVMTDDLIIVGQEKLAMVIHILTGISFVMLGILGIVFIFLGAYKKQLEIDNRIKQDYLLIQSDHYNQLYSHMREIRKIKHDINAHINVLYNQINSKQYNDALKYINDIKIHYDVSKALETYYNNGIIDAIIYDFKQKNPLIEFQCTGNFTGKTEISDFSICTILSNCISNAVDACSKLQKTEKEISINISNVKQHMIIIIENPIEWDVDILNLQSNTSKNNKFTHGYGIENIINEVKACGGKYNFCADNGTFIVKIAIENNSI